MLTTIDDQTIGRLRDNLRQRWKGAPRYADGRVRITVSDDTGVTDRMTLDEAERQRSYAIEFIGARLSDCVAIKGDKYVAESWRMDDKSLHNDTRGSPQPIRYAHIVVDRSQFDGAGPLYVDYDLQLRILATPRWRE